MRVDRVTLRLPKIYRDNAEYKLENPESKTIYNIGKALFKGSKNENYFSLKQILAALPMMSYTEKNGVVQIMATQQYGSSHNYAEVKYRQIDIYIDYSKTAENSFLSARDIYVANMVTGNRINLNLSFVLKNGILLTTVQDALKIISLDNYYKIVLLDDKNCYHFSVITSTQDAINTRGKGYSVSDAKIWSFWKAANWQLKRFPGGITADEFIHKFKLEWIRTYKEAIKAASDYYNLPVLVLAGVMYVEAGGDPPIADAVAYYIRDTFCPKVVNGIASFPYMSGLKGEAIKTSFGDISMQIRVAAETLNYPNPNVLSEAERDAIIESLKTAEIGLFICAKHLLALKNVDYPHLTKNQLSDNHVRIITTRYLYGAGVTLDYIQNNTVYGDRVLKNKSAINEAVK